MAKYKLTNVKGDFQNHRRRFECQLLEDDCVIAKVVRKAALHYFDEVQFKFYSEVAKWRFQDFCNCESMAETIEAMASSWSK